MLIESNNQQGQTYNTDPAIVIVPYPVSFLKVLIWYCLPLPLSHKRLVFSFCTHLILIIQHGIKAVFDPNHISIFSLNPK